MSKTITYRGQIPTGEQEKLHLSTNDGLTGYRIKKFQVISTVPGGGNAEYVIKVRLTKDDNVGPTINFNDPSIVAVAFHTDRTTNESSNETIIFDSEVFNQDIFVTCADVTGNTVPCNYYLELEKMKLDLNASTFSTLKNIRERQSDKL
jgi:hypothetical protein